MKKIVNAAVLGLGLALSAAPLMSAYAATTESAGTALYNSKITGNVKLALMADKSITNAQNISVTTNSGVVTLTGTAESDDQSQAAQAIAKSVTGVVNVQNNLTVKGS